MIINSLKLRKKIISQKVASPKPTLPLKQIMVHPQLTDLYQYKDLRLRWRLKRLNCSPLSIRRPLHLLLLGFFISTFFFIL